MRFPIQIATFVVLLAQFYLLNAQVVPLSDPPNSVTITTTTTRINRIRPPCNYSYCFDRNDFAGIVVGTVAATIVFLGLVGFLIWMCSQKYGLLVIQEIRTYRKRNVHGQVDRLQEHQEQPLPAPNPPTALASYYPISMRTSVAMSLIPSSRQNVGYILSTFIIFWFCSSLALASPSPQSQDIGGALVGSIMDQYPDTPTNDSKKETPTDPIETQLFGIDWSRLEDSRKKVVLKEFIAHNVWKKTEGAAYNGGECIDRLRSDRAR
ncbi:hypothetical protein BJ508DRAFT_304112 [Ascobolus immersus RN42]|uniref:Uncharacterized protein n=1 Tax=Ascobolus immersus RN42 TaxID=1160509 RepID=A0A3N4ICV8_ASCIM|nr:hypothetical protein BJ508DRAFT_304112 [Ascobolus immersus RN42]